MKLVVTGTGRSGTGYCAGLLRAAGVNCGHEGVYGPATVLGRQLPDWGDFEADASWMAVPALPWNRVYGAHHVVLVVRHPLDVVRSMLGLGVMDRWDDYQAVIRESTPLTLAEPTAADRAMAHWATWNMAASICADEVVQLERIDVADVARWLRLLGRSTRAAGDAVASVPADTNAKTEAKQQLEPLRRDMFRPGVLRTAEMVAAVLGYPPGWLPT